MQTIVVIIIVAAAAAWLVWNRVKRSKGCGCGCSGCGPPPTLKEFTIQKKADGPQSVEKE